MTACPSSLAASDARARALNPEGTLKWSVRTAQAVAVSPCSGTNGDIYVGDNSGRLYSFNLQGRTNWIFQASGAVASGATVAADGTIFFTTSAQNLYAVKPNGALLWQTSNAGIMLDGSVLLQDGRLAYSTTAGTLVAVRTAQRPGAQDWATFRGDYERTGRVPSWLTLESTNFNESLHAGESLTLQPRWRLGTQEVIRADLLVGTNVVMSNTNWASPLMWLGSSVGNSLLSVRLTTASGKQYTTRQVSAAVQALALTYRLTSSNTLAFASTALPDHFYSLESSSNLLNWIEVTSALSTNAGVMAWPDDTRNSSRKFYRIRAERRSSLP